MSLSNKSLNLAYKLVANVGVTNYNDHIPDVQRMLLAAFVDVYTNARLDEREDNDYDPAIDINFGDVEC